MTEPEGMPVIAPSRCPYCDTPIVWAVTAWSLTPAGLRADVISALDVDGRHNCRKGPNDD